MSENEDARWIKAFRMQAGVLQELDEATMRRERVAVRKILRMEKAAHVLPVGLIQLTDFASDIMVIVQIATTAGGAAADWIVCAVAVGLSLLVAWVWLAGGHNVLSLRERLIGCVLACGNLHVLYVGTRYVSALYEGRPSRDVERLYSLFVELKVFETGIESVVLGMVTAGAFVRTLVFGGAGLALFASSLALSLLSMAYGFFGSAADQYKDEVAHRRPAVFVCILVHLCWGLAAFGALAAVTAGAWWLLGVGAMLSLAGVRLFLERKAAGEKGCELIGWTLFAVFMLGLPLILVDYDVLDRSGGSPSAKRALAVFRRAALLGVAATAVALNPNPALAAVLASFFLLDLLCSSHLLCLLGIIEWDPLGALQDKCTRHRASDAVAPSPPAASAAVPMNAAERGTAGDNAALHDMLDAIDMQCAAPTGGAAAGAARPEATGELGTEAKTLRGEARAGTLSFDLFAAIVATLGEYKPWEKDAQKTLLDKLRGRHTAEGQAALAEPPEARPRLTHPLRALPLAAGLAADVWATRPSFFGAQPTGTNYELSVNSVVVDFFVRRPSLRPLRPPRPTHHRVPIRSTGEPRVARRARAQGADAPLLPLPRRSARTDHGPLAAARRLPPAPRCRHLRVAPLVSVVGAEPAATRGARPRVPVGGAEQRRRHATRLATVGDVASHDLARYAPVAHAPPLSLCQAAMRARLLTRGCRDADKCCIDQSSPEMIAAGVSSFGAFLARCENMVAFTSPNYFSRLWCVPAPNHPPAFRFDCPCIPTCVPGACTSSPPSAACIRTTWTSGCCCCRPRGRASSTRSSRRS
jgi:hypothetical protein